MILGMILRAVAAIWRISYFTDIAINRSCFFVKNLDVYQNTPSPVKIRVQSEASYPFASLHRKNGRRPMHSTMHIRNAFYRFDKIH